MFKVNIKDTLVSLLLTWNIFDRHRSSISIVYFEHVNAG